MINNGTHMRMLHSAGKRAKRQPATGAGARKKTKRGASLADSPTKGVDKMKQNNDMQDSALIYRNCSSLKVPNDSGAPVTVKVGSVIRKYPRSTLKPWFPFRE